MTILLIVIFTWLALLTCMQVSLIHDMMTQFDINKLVKRALASLETKLK